MADTMNWSNLGVSTAVDLFDMFKNDWNEIMMSNYKNDMMVKNYYDMQSPQARMRDMRAAGINPYTAAQGIAGSGGSGGNVTPPNSGVGATSVAETAANLDNAFTNKTQSDNLDANTNLVKSQQKAQDILNEINEATKEDQKEEIRDRAAWQAFKAAFEKFYTENYPDLWNANLASAKKDADFKQAQIDYYEQNINNLKEEIKKLEQEVKTLRAQAEYYIAAAAEQESEELLNEKEANLKEKQAELMEWELKVNKMYGGDAMLATMSELNKVTPGAGTAYYAFMKTMKYEMNMMEQAGQVAGSNPEMYSWMEQLFTMQNNDAMKLYENMNLYMQYSLEYNDLCQAKAAGVLPAGCETMDDLDKKILSTKLDMMNARAERDKYGKALQAEYKKTHNGTIGNYMLYSLVSRIVTLMVPGVGISRAIKGAGSSDNVITPQGLGSGSVSKIPSSKYSEPDFSHIGGGSWTPSTTSY